MACFEHSNFFKVNVLNSRTTQLRAARNSRKKNARASTHQRRTGSPALRSNYELFNCNNFNIRYWSWNYRGCWHQTRPPMDPR